MSSPGVENATARSAGASRFAGDQLRGLPEGCNPLQLTQPVDDCQHVRSLSGADAIWRSPAAH